MGVPVDIDNRDADQSLGKREREDLVRVSWPPVSDAGAGTKGGRVSDEVSKAGAAEAINDREQFLFLSGGDMHPTEVIASHAGAQFVARARLEEQGESRPVQGSEDVTEIWGILVRVPEPEGGPPEPECRVVTDEGRTFAARVVTPTGAAAEPAATLAAARYWELPPSYVSSLRRATGLADVGTGDR